MNRSNSVL